MIHEKMGSKSYFLGQVYADIDNHVTIIENLFYVLRMTYIISQYALLCDFINNPRDSHIDITKCAIILRNAIRKSIYVELKSRLSPTICISVILGH
jgi:hypothetical protein